jgi:hypothetical protein
LGGAATVTSVFARTGAVVAQSGDYAAFYEPGLGNPATNGFVLSSTTGGVRSWIAPSAGAGGNVSNSGTPTAGQKATWVDATHIQGVADNALQWDGGATNLVAATGRSSLGLVVGTDVQAWDADLDVWATKTPYAGSVVVTTGKTFTDTNNLTLSGTDGSTLNVGAGGTLGTAAFTASSAYQAADADLTTWAGITPASGVAAFLGTPSSLNLRNVLTDENGFGVALFNGATAPDFTTGLTIGGAAPSGKLLQGDGAKFAPSTPTWPTLASLANTSYSVMSDGSSFVAWPKQITNSSTSDQTGFTSDQYLTGSSCPVATGDFKAKGQYVCRFDMAKTGGTGASVITVRIGTTGSLSDTTATMTFTFGAGTAVADTGEYEVVVNWRSVGSGTSAVISGFCVGRHNLATTGLFNNAAVWTIVGTTSGGFNSSGASVMGLSYNGGASFGGTNKVVQAILSQ